MRPETLQNLSNIGILIGLILAAVGGIGNYYFGKQVEKVKEKNNKIEISRRVEEARKDLIGFTIGAEGKAFFVPHFFSPLLLQLDILNESGYPVFDIRGHWIDLDENLASRPGHLWTNHPFRVEDIYPNHMALSVMSFDFSNRTSLRINIFLQFRMGGASQSFRAVKVGHEVKVAFQTQYGGKIVNDIPKDFPGYDPTNPQKTFD